MIRPPRGIIDTSVPIAHEAGRALDAVRLPHAIAISVVTLAELRAGVLAAPDEATRDRRRATLSSLDEADLLPIDRDVALRWADLRGHLAAARRRINVDDLWIAATALAHDLPVFTQDADFDAVEGVFGLVVHRV